ncbi:MAG: sugar phosphate isomerase/epimerase [Gemmatimonadota bacterium]|nr:sugar phosphate isomerase/epimerase [Gemmatimonadota bacterium]
MELGCSTILYGGHDLSVAMERIRSAGYRAIELCCIPGMAPHVAIGERDAYYRDIRRRAADHQLTIESLGASGNLDDKDRFLQILDAAAAVGAPLVTTGPGGKPDDEDAFMSTVEKINALAVQAARRGVRLSIKPHVGNAVYNTDTAFRFMQQVDRKWVGINYDATHIWRCPQREVPEESIGRISRYIISLRIRDVKGRQSAIGPVENQVAGQGDMDLHAQADAFRKIPGLRYAVLEIVGTREMGVDDVDGVLRRSFDYFQPLFE